MPRESGPEVVQAPGPRGPGHQGPRAQCGSASPGREADGDGAGAPEPSRELPALISRAHRPIPRGLALTNQC